MQEPKIEFVDIENVWYQPWWQSRWFAWLSIVFSCLIFAFLVCFLYRRGWFGKKMSCDQQALKKLQILAATPYDSQEKMYAAYFQITLILKNYFDVLYQVRLDDKSDEEIVPILKNLIDPKLQPLLIEFLQRAFQIKFARDPISEQMLQDDIKFVQKIIEQTRKDFDKVGRS
ncbi:hypothetical protein KBB68_00615 [Candidatus Babeliales bacterium]|nr:hypothetical protein [Candidatus Babeliales bacterium]